MLSSFLRVCLWSLGVGPRPWLYLADITVDSSSLWHCCEEQMDSPPEDMPQNGWVSLTELWSETNECSLGETRYWMLSSEGEY